MVGVRSLNFRKGDLAESLGILLIQGLAVVAPVPRTEDVGLDVVATLLRQDGPYRVIAENSFYVQLKAQSTRVIKFTTAEQVKWLKELELPLMIGSIDLSRGAIDLFACHRLTQSVIEHAPCTCIELHLDAVDETKAANDCRVLNVGPPILSWAVGDLSNPNFVSSMYAVLKPHLETAQRNIELRRSGRYEELSWITGSIPQLTHVSMMGGGVDPKSYVPVMNLAMPYLSACLMEAKGNGFDELSQRLAAVIDEMCRQGANRDPVVDEILKTNPW